MATFRTSTLATTALAAAALFAASSAQAGVMLNAFVGANPVPVLNGSNAFPGVDPILDPQGNGNYTIGLTVPNGNRAVAGTILNFQSMTMSQSYDPDTGPVSGITSAIGDSTTVQIRNAGSVAVTLLLTVTFDAFNFPTDDPKVWTSAIATSRLLGGATFTASEVVKDANGVVVDSVNHTLLTGVGSQSLTRVVLTGAPYSVVQSLSIFLPAGAIANIQKSDTFTAVPEPATVALLGAGLLGLAAVRRRKA